MVGRFFRSIIFSLLAVVSFAAPSGVLAQERCELLFRTSEAIIIDRGVALPARTGMIRELAKFATEFYLPAKWVEVGPPERRVRRLFVAVDYTNPELFQAYLERFNLGQELSKDVAGTLVLEFAKEAKGGQAYVTGVLRPSEGINDQIYRWGRPDMNRQSWWKTYFEQYYLEAEHKQTGLMAFAHLIELNAAEKANVQYFLQHSDVGRPNEIVGKCKSDNCVAWTAGIELGKTGVGATAEDRKHLFTELGVARAMAHFEIGRRLVHAANDRHTAIVALVNGQTGIDTFKTSLEQYLVPEPKIPYASIIKGVQFASPALGAVRTIADGAKIFVPIAAGASPEAINALVEHAATLNKGVDVHVLVNGISANDFRKGVETTDGKFRVHALFLGSNLRELHSEGKVSVIPGNLSDFTRMMRDPQNSQFHYDTMIVRVSKPDAQGRYSLGPNNDMIMTILRERPNIKIIAEVNENVPFTTGKNFLTEDQISAKFESKTELAGPAAVPANAIDAAIGKNIGELIDSGATLQIGIGNIFSGVPDGLQQHGKSGIKISTEMFGDAMMELMKRGIADRAETGFAYGSGDLYRWLEHNPDVVFKETEVVNAPGRVSRIKKFHAVNTALQVNLFGEVNATMGPNGRISSPGGQVEFMSGAARSKGGKAIIAIRSTAKNGELSTIVLDLYAGPITTPHESVTHVVTEYGIAKLQGKSESQRAVALITIAHPKFRKALIDQAIGRKLITVAEAATIPRG